MSFSIDQDIKQFLFAERARVARLHVRELTENLVVQIVRFVELHVVETTARNKHSRSFFHFHHFPKFLVWHLPEVQRFNDIFTDFLHALMNVFNLSNVHDKRIAGYFSPSVRDVRLIPKLPAQNDQVQMNVKVLCFLVERKFKCAEITFDSFLENFFPLEIGKILFQLCQAAVERRGVLHRQGEKTKPPCRLLHNFTNLDFGSIA